MVFCGRFCFLYVFPGNFEKSTDQCLEDSGLAKYRVVSSLSDVLSFKIDLTVQANVRTCKFSNSSMRHHVTSSINFFLKYVDLVA